MGYNFAIKWGNDHEDIASEWFRNEVAPVSTVGFCQRFKGDLIGCSPDRLIPEGGDSEDWHAGLEIKCPSPDTHTNWAVDGVLPVEHALQVHGSMVVTGLNSWHFLSYHPRCKPFHLIIKRDEFTQKVEESLNGFVKLYKYEGNRVMEAITEGGVAA
jgi:hypothetical protein